MSIVDAQLLVLYSGLLHRIETLDAGLGFACEALAKLAAEIGPTTSGPVAAKLRAFDPAAIAAAASADVDELDELVRSGRIPAATRRYRELFEVVWDDAGSAIGGWHLNPKSKDRFARMLAARRRVDFLRDLVKTTP